MAGKECSECYELFTSWGCESSTCPNYAVHSPPESYASPIRAAEWHRYDASGRVCVVADNIAYEGGPNSKGNMPRDELSEVAYHLGYRPSRGSTYCNQLLFLGKNGSKFSFIRCNRTNTHSGIHCAFAGASKTSTGKAIAYALWETGALGDGPAGTTRTTANWRP